MSANACTIELNDAEKNGKANGGWCDKDLEIYTLTSAEAFQYLARRRQKKIMGPLCQYSDSVQQTAWC